MQTYCAGKFELTPAIPTPAKARSDLLSPAGDSYVDQRLSFESFQTVTSTVSSMQAQLKYEREVCKTLTSELEKSFPTQSPVSPSSICWIPCTTFRKCGRPSYDSEMRTAPLMGSRTGRSICGLLRSA